MNTPMLAVAYNLNPQQQIELYQLQRVCPEALPGHDTSSDDDDVHHHLVRLQPCADAILYNEQPRGSQYSGSCCADALRLWSDQYFMRSVVSAWANQCECGYHDRIVDLSIPPRHSYIRAHRLARAREERLAYRHNCIQNIHHARLRCVEFMACGQGRVGARVEEQRRASAGRETESLISRVAAVFGRDVSSNDLGPPFSTFAEAAEARIFQLLALHEEQHLLRAGRESTSEAGAVLRSTAAFAKFCGFSQVLPRIGGPRPDV